MVLRGFPPSISTAGTALTLYYVFGVLLYEGKFHTIYFSDAIISAGVGIKLKLTKKGVKRNDYTSIQCSHIYPPLKLGINRISIFILFPFKALFI